MSTKTDKTKYSIGQMATLCNISKKQLRYYDQNGVLTPRLRDPETNYRFYSQDQIGEVLLLLELKNLDFPLKDIGQIMSSNRELSRLQHELEKRLYHLREEVRQTELRYNQTMDILLRLVNSRNTRTDLASCAKSFQIVEYEKRVILSTRYVSYWHADRLFLERRAELMKLSEEQGFQSSGLMTAVFHSDYLRQFSILPEDAEGDFEVCLTIAAHNENLPNCRSIGPFRAVAGTYTGHYSDMRPFYVAMEEWASDNHCLLSGVSLEEYVVNCTMTGDPESYTTKIYLPLKGSKV